MPPYGAGRGLNVASPFLLDVDFSTFAVGSGSAALAAAGLSFSRALNAKSSSETVQTSDTTVLSSGLTANVPRIGQRTSSSTTRGIVLEESRTNLFPQCRQIIVSPLTAGTVTSTSDSFTAADGATVNRNRCQPASGGESPYYAGGSFAAACFSAWVRSGNGSTNSWQIAVGDGTGNTRGVGGTVGPTWQRAIVTCTGCSSIACVPVDGRNWTGGPGAGARDAAADLMQAELIGSTFPGRFATEVVISDATSTTRLGERLWHPTGSALVDGGRFTALWAVIPKGDSSNYNTSSIANQKIRLVTFGASDYIEWDASTHKISVVVGGSAWTPTTVVTWSQFDLLELFVGMGSASINSIAKYRLNGGSVVDLGNSGSAQGALSPGSTADLLCNSTSNQFTCWFQHFSAFKSGQKPSWA